MSLFAYSLCFDETCCKCPFLDSNKGKLCIMFCIKWACSSREMKVFVSEGNNISLRNSWIVKHREQGYSVLRVCTLQESTLTELMWRQTRVPDEKRIKQSCRVSERAAQWTWERVQSSRVICAAWRICPSFALCSSHWATPTTTRKVGRGWKENVGGRRRDRVTE